MRRIHILDSHIANRIAAGEVVERPASIVKELVENAVDAGAKNISIEIRNGGIDYIRVTDDGCGIPAGEAVLAFSRHATSKIREAEDLESIESLGFRGEALASIAAVSQVCMRSCEKDAEMGVQVRIHGGECKENIPVGCARGSSFEVENLFYNVPARLKFLKSARTEAGAITDYVARMLLAYPHIAFRLIQNGRTIYQSAGDGDLKNAIFTVYGSEVLPHLKSVFLDDGYIRIRGYIGTERIARNNRLAQSFFVNSRYVRSQRLSYAVQLAYDTRLMGGKFPFICLDIAINCREVDPNVHPNKLEVRFKDEERVFQALSRASREALSGSLRQIPEIQRQDVQLPMYSVWEKGTVKPAEETPKKTVSEEKKEGEKPIPAEAEALTRLQDRMDAQSGSKETFRFRESAASEAPSFPPSPKVPRITVMTEKRENPEGKAAAPIPAAVPKKEECPMPSPVQSRLYTMPPEEKQEVLRMEALDGEFHVVGQLFSCYWVVEQEDTVFFIDQHAAHERILYEKFMEQGLEARSQLLLLPQALRLNPQEYQSLMENLEAFREIGFEIEEFGPLTVSVRAVPFLLDGPETASYLREALGLLTAKNRLNAAELKREALIQSACKHAIKAGDRLTETEIRALLREFHERGIPMTCPHGRPVMLKMKKTEFEKLFKRSV